MTHKLVAQIESELRLRIGPVVRKIRLEIMDAGGFLLIVIDPLPNGSSDENRKVLEIVRDFVGPIIPPRRGHYSWMAVIDRGGRIEDVENSEMLI